MVRSRHNNHHHHYHRNRKLITNSLRNRGGAILVASSPTTSAVLPCASVASQQPNLIIDRTNEHRKDKRQKEKENKTKKRKVARCDRSGAKQLAAICKADAEEQWESKREIEIESCN